MPQTLATNEETGFALLNIEYRVVSAVFEKRKIFSAYYDEDTMNCKISAAILPNLANRGTASFVKTNRDYLLSLSGNRLKVALTRASVLVVARARRYVVRASTLIYIGYIR